VKRAALLAVLLLAGCGGSAPPPRVAPPPHIPRALAQAWATQADAVAQSLAAGDGCTALAKADALRASVATSQARVPARLRVQLIAVVEQLPGRITCNPPPAPPPPKPRHEHPHPRPHPHHGHGHDHGDHG
jgi:hypothetical protein